MTALKDSPQVTKVSSTLERQIREEIQRKGLSVEDLALKLGLLPIGAEVLLGKGRWPIDLAVQVAEAIGLKVEFTLNAGE